MKNAKKYAPIPRLESSHFKPYLEAPETTSVIDEFSPKKSFYPQDTIESSIQDSQFRHTVTQPPNESLYSAPGDGLFDDDIAQKMQDAEDAYLNLDGQENGIETPNEEQPTTVSNVDQFIFNSVFTYQSQDPDSAEQEPRRSQSPAESVNAPVPVSPFVSHFGPWNKSIEFRCSRRTVRSWKMRSFF
jgi:hypothetical protein